MRSADGAIIGVLAVALAIDGCGHLTVPEWCGEAPPAPVEVSAAPLVVEDYVFYEDGRAARRILASDLLDKGWRWVRCDDGTMVWLDSGGAEVRLGGCP